MNQDFKKLVALFCVLPAYLLVFMASVRAAQTVPLSPDATVASADGATLYVGCATANCILCMDTASCRVTGSILVSDRPTGMAISKDAKWLLVTCAAPESHVCVIDLAKRRGIASIAVGHTAMAPVLSPDGKTLYVCNRFDNDVSVIDLVKKKEITRIAVQREPVAATITKDGSYLLVANFLPTGRADRNYVAAAISVISTTTRKVVKELPLPSGSGSLNDISVSPDGRYAVVVHVVGRFTRLPTHIAEGWINANALTVIDLPELTVHGTTLLDDHYAGAANPWCVAWTADSGTLVVTHAGTHEISVINFPRLLETMPALSPDYDPVKSANDYEASRSKSDLPDDLPFFPGGRRRIKLPEEDRGPRAVTVVGRTAYVASYFSDSLTCIDLKEAEPTIKSIALGPKVAMDTVRKGEFYFHDAGICYDGWQSCASCHPGEARVDGLNWDLLNDGVGNAKNTKSLLLATKISPVMSMGVRADAKAAVRAGLQYILFADQPDDEVVDSIVAYLVSLKPIPSPSLVHGQLSKAAKRGEKIFKQAGCATCHVPGLYTDQLPHDVGTRGANDQAKDEFYTPTLIEAWRTAPYLHDGSAATLRDVLIARNPKDGHGTTSKLSEHELEDLCAFVLSL